MINRLVVFDSSGKAVCAGCPAMLPQPNGHYTKVIALPGTVDFITVDVVGKTEEELRCLEN